MKKLLSMMVLALVLTGCSTGTATDAAATATTDAAATAEADPNVANMTNEPGVLKVGMECNYAPFNWTQTEANDTAQSISSADYCDGYDVVMATQIAEGLGLEVKIVKTDWDGLIPALNNGEIDCIIAGMTDTPERAESVNFTTPYYESQMVVVVRADSDLTGITNIQDLSGYTVLGQQNTLYDEIIDQIDGVNHATPQDSYPRMVLSLQSGEVDAITAELPVATGVVAANPDLAIVTFDGTNGFEADTSVSIATAKNNEALLTSIQSVLDGISEADRQTYMLDATDRQPATAE